MRRIYAYYKAHGHDGTICMPASWRPSRGPSDPAFATDEIVALAGPCWDTLLTTRPDTHPRHAH